MGGEAVISSHVSSGHQRVAKRTFGTLKRSAKKSPIEIYLTGKSILARQTYLFNGTPHQTGFSPLRLMNLQEATNTNEIGARNPKEFDKYDEVVEKHRALVHQAF